MPGERNGLDLARIVRRDRPALPVVLMTGYTAELQRALAEGFRVLQKPCSPDTLASALLAADQDLGESLNLTVAPLQGSCGF